MKKRLFFVALAALCAGLFFGCGNDAYDGLSDSENGDDLNDEYKGLSFFAETDEETIIEELDSVPAFVTDSIFGIVTISYSKYADEYWTTFYNDKERFYSYYASFKYPYFYEEAQEHQIAVEWNVFRKYHIPFRSKVYVSASVTNLTRVNPLLDPFDYHGSFNVSKKAYLKNIVERND